MQGPLLDDQEFFRFQKALADLADDDSGKVDNNIRRQSLWESVTYFGNIIADPNNKLRPRALEVLLNHAFSSLAMLRQMIGEKLYSVWCNTKPEHRELIRLETINCLKESRLYLRDGQYTDDPDYQTFLCGFASDKFCKIVALLSPRPIKAPEYPLENNRELGEPSTSRKSSISSIDKVSDNQLSDLQSDCESFTISEMHDNILEQKENVEDKNEEMDIKEEDNQYPVDEKGFTVFDRNRMKCDYRMLRTISYSYLTHSKKISKIIDEPTVLTEKFVRSNFEHRTLFVNRENGFGTILEGNCIYKTRMEDYDETELRIPIPEDSLSIGGPHTLDLLRTEELAEQIKKLSGKGIGAVRLVHDRERDKHGLLMLHEGNPFLFTDNGRGKNVGYVDQLRGHGNWGIIANNDKVLNCFDSWVRKAGPFEMDDKPHWQYLTDFLKSLRDNDIACIHPSTFYKRFDAYLENQLIMEEEKESEENHEEIHDLKKSGEV